MAMKNPKETVQGSAGRAQSILSASLLTARDYLGEHNATVVKLLISMGVGAGLKQSSTPTSNVKTTQAKVAHEDANVPATQDTKSFLARLSSNTKGLTVMTNAPLPIPAAKPNPTPKTLEDQMNAMNTEILDANAPTHSTLTSFKLDQVFNTLDKQGKPVPLDPAHEYYAVLQYLTPLQRAVLGTLKEKTKDTYDRVLADLREDWDIEF